VVRCEERSELEATHASNLGTPSLSAPSGRRDEKPLAAASGRDPCHVAFRAGFVSELDTKTAQKPVGPVGTVRFGA
jgi:hypothetical protein